MELLRIRFLRCESSTGSTPGRGSMQTSTRGSVKKGKIAHGTICSLPGRIWDYSGLHQPDPKSPEPKAGTKEDLAYKAWEEMYAAEGSDWFWWYATAQTAPAGDKPFDIAYITHLRNIYAFALQAGGSMPQREFKGNRSLRRHCATRLLKAQWHKAVRRIR